MMIFGRSSELAHLSARLDLAYGGSGQIMLVSGPAGIGKTNLLDCATLSWESRGGATLCGRSPALVGHELPYLPWAQALDSPRGTLSTRALENLGRAARCLQSDVQGGPRSQAAAFWQALVRTADETPLLVVLDDLQWSDDSSLGLLASGIAELPRAPIFLAVAFRVSPDMNQSLRHLWPEWERLELCHHARLSALEDGAIVQLLKKAGYDGRTEELLKRAAGNPYYALTLARAASDSSRATLPASLLDFLSSQLILAGEDVRRLAQTVALAGGSMEFLILARAFGGDGVSSEKQIIKAVNQNILIFDVSTETVALAHDLIGEAATHLLGPEARASIHRALALAYESATQDVPFRTPKMATHWREAGEAPRAFEAYLLAADEASSSGAYKEQWHHLEQAMLLSERSAPASEERRKWMNHLPIAAEASYRAGNAAMAARLAQQALDSMEPEIADELDLAERLVQYLRWAGDGPAAVERARLTARRAGSAEGVSVLRKAEITATLAGALIGSGQAEEAMEAAAQVLALCAEQPGDRSGQTRANALTTTGIAYALAGRIDEGVEILDQALALARQHDAGENLLRTLNNHSFVLQEAGRYEAAAGDALEGYLLAGELHLDLGVNGLCISNLVSCLEWLGRWDEAMTWVGKGLKDAVGYEIKAGLHGTAALILAYRGEQVEALAWMETALKDIRKSVLPGVQFQLTAMAADVALASGEYVNALNTTVQALESPALHEEPRDVLYMATLGLLASSGARPFMANSSIEERVKLLGTAGLRAAAENSGVVQQAWATTFGAAFAAVSGAQSTPEWLKAAQQWESLSNPLWAIRCLNAAGSADLHRNRRRATRLLSKARSQAIALGASQLIQGIEAQALSTNLVLADQVAPGKNPSLPWGLTARELEVLEFLTHGASNRIIGRELLITERTAGVHVSHILTKLRVKTRAEAAAIAFRERMKVAAE
jgi:DNA-binding CsgD family transcriptional regulator/tetratricopeptide (TPR) repeat protein